MWLKQYERAILSGKTYSFKWLMLYEGAIFSTKTYSFNYNSPYKCLGNLLGGIIVDRFKTRKMGHTHTRV